jgi:hypothetical protein
MIAIALELDGLPILDGDDHAARVGAIVRADQPDRFRFTHVNNSSKR